VVEQPLRSVKDRMLDDVRGTNGGLRGSHGALAAKYGVSPTRIGQVIRDLKKEGIVRVRSSRNGTTIVPALGLALAN
jgi:DNA-binding GntR family transcriptional regulator